MEIKKIVEGMTAPQVAKVIEYNFNEADQKKADKTELSELKKKVDNLKPSIVTGDVVNNADEEDITSLDNKLKLKDRVSYEGMGYVIIRKHKTFADQVTQPNTIYEIRYEFDLGGEQITIPAECELLFIGGKIKNGSILFQNTHLNGHPLIEADIVSGSFFKNVILEIDWFGAKKDNPNFDNALVFEKMHKIKSNDTGNGFILMLGNGVYYSSSFRVAANATYRGQGGGTILKSISNGSTYSFGSQTPINNVFIAIQSPRVVIDNFVIDGGGLEGYNTCAVGAYQAGFLFTMKNIIVKNCKVGCFISSADGGFFKIHDCEFYSAGSYCIKFNGVVDSLSVERCNFEGWFVNGETNDWNRLANTSVIDLSGKLMKKTSL